MPKSSRPKKKPPIKASNNESTFTFSFLSSSSSSALVRQGERREHPQTPEKEKEKEKENQKPAKKTTKPTTTTTDSIPSILFPPLSPKQHLQKALESLTQAYKGLKEEEKEEKHQVKQLECYTQSILAGGKPFIHGKEQAVDVLKGVVEEVKALRKEIAPIKETYAERLKKGLPSLSSLPSSLLLPILSAPSPSSRSSTSTKNKKKQL